MICATVYTLRADTRGHNSSKYDAVRYMRNRGYTYLCKQEMTYSIAIQFITREYVYEDLQHVTTNCTFLNAYVYMLRIKMLALINVKKLFGSIGGKPDV